MQSTLTTCEQLNAHKLLAVVFTDIIYLADSVDSRTELESRYREGITYRPGDVCWCS